MASGNAASTASAEASREALSTTITSRSCAVDAASDPRQRTIQSFSLYEPTTTLIVTRPPGNEPLPRTSPSVAATHPDLRYLPGRRESSGPWWRAVADNPRLAPAALPYAVINGLAKVDAKRRLRGDGAIAWDRDETTRSPAPAARP